MKLHCQNCQKELPKGHSRYCSHKCNMEDRNKVALPPVKENDKIKRKERLAIWVEKATAHFDTPQIRKEAIEIFNKQNPQ